MKENYNHNTDDRSELTNIQGTTAKHSKELTLKPVFPWGRYVNAHEISNMWKQQDDLSAAFFIVICCETFQEKNRSDVTAAWRINGLFLLFCN